MIYNGLMAALMLALLFGTVKVLFVAVVVTIILAAAVKIFCAVPNMTNKRSGRES